MIAGVIDASIDVGVSACVAYSLWQLRSLKLSRYPVGRRSTLQPATVLVFACVTGTLSATVAIEAVQSLAAGDSDTIPLGVDK